MIDYIDIIRTICISFFITLILGPIIIPMLRRLKIGQNVREEGPKTHLKKNGTPTMGGIIIFIALLITVLTSGMLNTDMYILLIATFGFGLIGFIDDYVKIVKKRSLGLKPYQKLIGNMKKKKKSKKKQKKKKKKNHKEKKKPLKRSRN